MKESINKAAIRCHDDALLVSHTAVVAAGEKSIFRPQRLVGRGEVEGIAAIWVVAGSHEPIGAQLNSHASAGPRFQVIKQQFGFQRIRLSSLAKKMSYKSNVRAVLTNLLLARRRLVART